ncbi:VPLPA-CTERM protein sorting domain-containing protein [Syntrophus gentianae]|uniref:VPLPA-CTERM protein sorting domain-containing protein n=1 Tax=Syntrophus gentianae TaxID=43775 RepID=A0A1H7U9M7_9BACT|nr:VPLPA-CTERM sorting domain-containing protein [Syntrophus gentianae]SEL93466.1 VPLPA-CTERM protein sorting domain-containing protein [Syntrophus gentianae]
MKKILLFVCACLMFLTLGTTSFAATVLLSDSGGALGYGYGYSSWTNMTNALDTATGNQVTVVSNFSNLSQMMTYDALWLDQRWTSGSLAATEVSNIASFIATGRKVVMIGENSSWTSWNNQILGIVGGTFAGESSATAYPIVFNSLTNGISSIDLPTAGLANGGTALFDQNFATLWGSNVLTLLDVNVLDNSYGNAQFETNVANWVADSGPVVPIPAAVWLLGSGLIGLFGLRRKFN